MSKLLNTLAVASALCIAPAYAAAEVSLADALDLDTAITLDEVNASDSIIANPHHRTTHVEVKHYRTNYRPRVVQPVVVVEQPQTVVVAESSAAASSTASVSTARSGARFGMGVRGVGLKQSAIKLVDGGCLGTELNGGVGYYIKFRPVRWVSIEFINDYMFGTYESKQEQNISGNYVKIPVSIGLRAHIFDYGMLDVYAAAAASLTFNSLSSGYNMHTYDPGYDDTHFAQFGGQFGGGASFVLGGFEIGADVRYTIDEAPDSSIYGRNTVDQKELIHGVLFSLNVGFAI